MPRICKIIKIILKSKISNVYCIYLLFILLYDFIKDMNYLLYKIIKDYLNFEELVLLLFNKEFIFIINNI
jgi:hypothetical protein